MIIAATLVAALAPAVRAEWSYTLLHPDGLANSIVRAVRPSVQAGQAAHPGAPLHAALWSGSAASWVDIHPDGWEIPQGDFVRWGDTTYENGKITTPPIPFLCWFGLVKD